MIIKSHFKPAWWLPNAHLQTIYSALMRRLPACIDLPERVELPDGDFIDLSWSVHGLKKDSPIVILLHGLGGNIHSSYVGGFMRAFNACGWRAVLMHFRGASHEPNRLPRFYHSGDTQDLDYVLRLLNEREPHTKKAVIGVSLGGNVLLKWLGENRDTSFIQAAVAVSVPFQLNLAADRVNRGFSRIYQRHLLRNLNILFNRKVRIGLDTGSALLNSAQKWKCFWTFDEFVTAPLNGFRHVHDYYRAASSRRYLRHIKTPTLIIHASDDPFMTPEIIPYEHELSSAITLELSETGGHVGFITGSLPGAPVYWLDDRIPEYLESYLDTNYSLVSKKHSTSF
ncbi:MAG: hydrolase [Legionella sp.]|nr:hydrolase [Legionella sp.]